MLQTFYTTWVRKVANQKQLSGPKLTGHCLIHDAVLACCSWSSKSTVSSQNNFWFSRPILVMLLSSEGQNVSANQILSTHLNPGCYNYFCIRKKTILHRRTKFSPNQPTRGRGMTLYRFLRWRPQRCILLPVSDWVTSLP